MQHVSNCKGVKREIFNHIPQHSCIRVLRMWGVRVHDVMMRTRTCMLHGVLVLIPSHICKCTHYANTYTKLTPGFSRREVLWVLNTCTCKLTSPCAGIHKGTHAYTHTHTHTRTLHTYSHTCTLHTLITHLHTHIHKPMHTHTHTCTHTNNTHRLCTYRHGHMCTHRHSTNMLFIHKSLYGRHVQ